MQLLILDRDGVINQDSDAYIKSPGEWQAIPGSLEAIARISNAGWRVVVATNQSGIARRLFDIQTLNEIHRKMHQALADLGGTVEAVFFCPHAPRDNCKCRKPLPGLLHGISERLNTSLDGVPLIGDTKRDLDAAISVGARPILVRTGKGRRSIKEHPELAAVETYDDLAQAVDRLLEEGAPGEPG